MSKTYRSNVQRTSTMRREEKYSGWEGEGYSPEVRKLNKDRSHRDARRTGKRQGQIELMAMMG